MQQEETPGLKDDHIDSPSSGKQSPNKDAEKNSQSAEASRGNEVIDSVNGIDAVETGHVDTPASNNETRPQLSSPIANGSQLPGNSQLNQPLHFELGPEVGNNFTIGNYWGMSADDSNPMQSFQSFNTSTMQNYGLNNNNSFHQPLPFGSIGQPSFVATNSQFSSPPGMPNMSMLNNMGQVNNHVGGFGYQNTQNQNQRRAITAQHNYGAVNNKSLNPRLPWSSQQSPWPNTSQQNTTMSPWTMALQQQRAKGGINGVQMAKKGQSHSALNMNQNPAINNFLVQQKMKRASSAPNQALNSNVPKSYSVPIGSDRGVESSGLSYTVCLNVLC